MQRNTQKKITLSGGGFRYSLQGVRDPRPAQINQTNKIMEKIKKFTLYVGLNDKDTKRQEITDEAALVLIKNEVARRFGGGTIYKASGIYTHDSGEVVDENTYRVELLFAEDGDVKEFVTMLKTALNQESIAVQVELINSELW